jgi:hypothetical protein
MHPESCVSSIIQQSVSLRIHTTNCESMRHQVRPEEQVLSVPSIATSTSYPRTPSHPTIELQLKVLYIRRRSRTKNSAASAK